jgi:poly-gamma-glutamate synthesis protein (capsule biosynthesis protein)
MTLSFVVAQESEVLGFNFEKIEEEHFKKEEEQQNHVSLTFVGDLMCHSPQFKHALQSDGSYDFYPVFEPVAEYLSKSDFTVGNLETVLAGTTKSYSGYPQFNTPNSYADALKKAGFDLIVTANNHSYDKKEAGVLRTIKELKKRKFLTAGTYTDAKKRDAVQVIQIKNIKVSILAYTQFSNLGVPKAKKHLVNVIDTALVKKDIQNARKAGAEVVLVHYHWGSEYIREPNTRQKTIAEQTIALGADLIIGGHPHYVQPVDFYKTKGNAALDSGVIAYSMGNFFSNQRKRFRDAGLILTINLEKNPKTGKIKVEEVEYIPTWVFKGVIDKKTAYRVLPSQIAQGDSLPFYFKDYLLQHTNFLTTSDWTKITQAFNDDKYIVPFYNDKINLGTWKEKSIINTKVQKYNIPKADFSNKDRLIKRKKIAFEMPEVLLKKGRKKKKRRK